jgi:hypothetical protein
VLPHDLSLIHFVLIPPLEDLIRISRYSRCLQGEEAGHHDLEEVGDVLLRDSKEGKKKS